MAMVHSEENKGPQEITIIALPNGKYEAETKDGTRCTAIYNPFTGLYYADDIYGLLDLPF